MEAVKFEAGKKYGRWIDHVALTITKRTDSFIWVGGMKKKIKVRYIDGEPIESFDYLGSAVWACVER